MERREIRTQNAIVRVLFKKPKTPQKIYSEAFAFWDTRHRKMG